MLHIDKRKGLGRDYTLYTLNNFTFEPGKLRSKSIENKEVTYINMPTIYHYFVKEMTLNEISINLENIYYF